MRLTRADGKILLGAIEAELVSQRYRKLWRDKYQPPLDWKVEQGLQDADALRAEELRAVRDKIRKQL